MKALAVDLIAINTVLLDKTVPQTTSLMWRRYKHTRQEFDTPTDERRPMIGKFDEITPLEDEGPGTLKIRLVDRYHDDSFTRELISYCGPYVIAWDEAKG